MKQDALFALLFYQTLLQQKMSELQAELIEAQRNVIKLQARIDEMTPKNVEDADVSWHIATGIMSDDAANSDDWRVVKRFQDWNIAFAKRYIKPYVNPRVFSEAVTQMTRGLPKRIAELETAERFGRLRPSTARKITPLEKRMVPRNKPAGVGD